VTDTLQPPLLRAAFRGPVSCRRTFNALILRGAAADSADDVLILTLVGRAVADLPASLLNAAVVAVGESNYRITSESRDWVVAATSAHLHRDIGAAFYRGVPPRRVPIRKRVFWRAVLALAGTRAGKRLLLALRGK
jgi:hypothetical protein